MLQTFPHPKAKQTSDQQGGSPKELGDNPPSIPVWMRVLGELRDTPWAWHLPPSTQVSPEGRSTAKQSCMYWHVTQDCTQLWDTGSCQLWKETPTASRAQWARTGDVCLFYIQKLKQNKKHTHKEIDLDP